MLILHIIFEVDGLHSFFIGETPVLVHNGCRGKAEYTPAQRREITNRERNSGRLTCEGANCRRGDLQSVKIANGRSKPAPETRRKCIMIRLSNKVVAGRVQRTYIAPGVIEKRIGRLTIDERDCVQT